MTRAPALFLYVRFDHGLLDLDVRAVVTSRKDKPAKPARTSNAHRIL
jgi:hypothetical protein